MKFATTRGGGLNQPHARSQTGAEWEAGAVRQRRAAPSRVPAAMSRARARDSDAEAPPLFPHLLRPAPPASPVG
eukprot:CAMPEP_0170145882 /NCGR_PEP_ID=MMETSP0033_2-20121228/26572_1 /TAXON_ID=195969 /ORGANISM="Dolichomastix tenuilepis, Strain CCMP3274" /LENGTH=73 /DNA_ID=CAMNT_0010382529 /DNA_START=47 /DNA_END=265 /DNA_ORIENTATION=+